MNSIKKFGYISGITVLYNVFFTKTADLLYKDKFFVERKENTAVFLVFVAIISIVMAHYGLDEYPTIKSGIKCGGIVLLVYTFLDNWMLIDDRIKLVIIGMFLVGLMAYS